MEFDEKIVQHVWEKSRIDANQDPNLWRKDECGAWIKRDLYKNHHSEFGWEIDYITPGGSTDPSNLRALQWRNILAGGSGHVVCKVTSEPESVKNKEAS